ncbi:hypothetical protein BDZ91DRAFT_736465, partial [Kalaharituber pfeilii]
KEFERAIGNLDAETNRVLSLSARCNFLLTARDRATHFQTRLQYGLENEYGDMVRDFHGEDKMDCDPDILNTEDTMIDREDQRTQEYIAALETLLDISNKVASMRNALNEELRLMWRYSTYVESTLSGLACESGRDRGVVVGPSNIGSAGQ